MQVRNTENPQHELVIRKPFDWLAYEGSLITGGNYNIMQTWATGLKPVRQDKYTWLVPKLKEWEGWEDGVRQFRIIGAVGVGVWTEGTYKQAVFLTWDKGNQNPQVSLTPPMDYPARGQWIDIEYQQLTWPKGEEVSGNSAPYGAIPSDLNEQNKLDILITDELAVGFYQEQVVAPLAAPPDPNPPCGFRLARGTIFIKLIYEWVTVDNMTMYKLRRQRLRYFV